jgi:hypothetical protein
MHGAILTSAAQPGKRRGERDPLQFGPPFMELHILNGVVRQGFAKRRLPVAGGSHVHPGFDQRD